jgi:Flp pilus assembly protein TadG
MKAHLSNTLRSFRNDRTGTTSLLFAGGLLATIIIIGAAIDYSSAVTARARLQAGVDSATLAAAKQGAENPSAYLTSTSGLKTAAQAFLTADDANATISDFHACLVSNGDCTTGSGQTLQVGQFYAEGTTTYTPLFNNVSWLPGSNSQTLTTSATAGANLQWPQQITLNLIGAKGWYYKTVTLYALPFTNGSAGSSYTALATWTYQPINLNSASGSYNVTVGTDPANGMTNLKLGSLGAGYGTLTGPTSVNLGQYADFFLVESVMQGPCSPADPWMPGNWSSNTYAFPGACYATQSAANSGLTSTIQSNCGSAPSKSSRNYQSELATYNNCVATYTPVQESVGWNVCSESELDEGSNPAYASYNSICNPYTGSNASYNSSNTQPWQFIFVSFIPTESYTNANVFSTSALVQLTSGSSPTTMFPCGQTVGHEWEDGGSIVGTSYATALSSAENASTTPQQDFFYSVSTTCGAEPGVAASGYTSSQTAQYGLAPQLVH